MFRFLKEKAYNINEERSRTQALEFFVDSRKTII